MQEAFVIAREAWKAFGKSLAKKRCPKCHGLWQKGRSERPPLFPPNYNDNCPVHEDEKLVEVNTGV